ncbi:MAG TPA: PAS domain-containing sensor histidine kinase [Steroidobacteraceae bacterium]
MRPKGVLVNQLMSQVVEFAPNGVAVTTADGRIVLSNVELERMFGYSRRQILELNIGRLIPERFRSSHAVLRDGHPSRFESRTVGAGRELFGLRANASEFPIEIGVSVVQTAEGPLVVETIVDISVRKRLERMFQKVVEAAPCGMVMVDAQGRIMLVNTQSEAMFGYQRAELIGNGLEMLLPERLRATHKDHRRTFAATPAIRQMGGLDADLTARRKDGSEFPVEIGLNPVPGEDEGLVLATVTDMTQRKSIELKLRQANADLEEFTSAASHDLKSPLRGISNLVEWIVEDLGPEAAPAVTRNLARVSDRIHRLERIIEDLLTYARAGVTAAAAVPVDLHELIAGIVLILAPPSSFRIRVHVEAQPCVAAKAPLETVLRNLISNAVKHHDRADGELVIRIADEGRYCLFTIADDGPGIPQAAQEGAFRMLHTYSSNEREHSGIGLALCKRMVAANGGRIQLESHDGVRGATFRVWWPRFQWVSHEQ